MAFQLSRAYTDVIAEWLERVGPVHARVLGLLGERMAHNAGRLAGSSDRRAGGQA